MEKENEYIEGYDELVEDEQVLTEDEEE